MPGAFRLVPDEVKVHGVPLTRLRIVLTRKLNEGTLRGNVQRAVPGLHVMDGSVEVLAADPDGVAAFDVGRIQVGRVLGIAEGELVAAVGVPWAGVGGKHERGMLPYRGWPLLLVPGMPS